MAENTATSTPATTNTNAVVGEQKVQETPATNTSAANAAPAASTPAPDANAPASEGSTVTAPVAEKAPEKYESFKLSEGVAIDEAILGKFTGMAKELNLSQEKAQKIIDLASEHAKTLALKSQESFKKVREEWVNAIKTDHDFGGAKFQETHERAVRALKAYGSREFASFLDVSGLGDNPELIKFLARVDRRTGEDSTVSGAPAGTQEQSAAQALYGKK